MLMNLTDISIENILVPASETELTGGLTSKDRHGTIVDWNLCFNANGTSFGRTFKSGTPAFMAPILLTDKQIPRRTLGHDMESFFAVIVWIASASYADELMFQDKPLAILLDPKKKPEDIINAKENWFKNEENFLKRIVDHFERRYLTDPRFIMCVTNLREILYPTKRIDVAAYMSRHAEKGEGVDYLLSQNAENEEDTGDADPMKEDLFRMCMKEIDNYLQETKGCDEMQWSDSQALARYTPKSLGK